MIVVQHRGLSVVVELTKAEFDALEKLQGIPPKLPIDQAIQAIAKDSYDGGYSDGHSDGYTDGQTDA